VAPSITHPSVTTALIPIRITELEKHLNSEIKYVRHIESENDLSVQKRCVLPAQDFHLVSMKFGDDEAGPDFLFLLLLFFSLACDVTCFFLFTILVFAHFPSPLTLSLLKQIFKCHA